MFKKFKSFIKENKKIEEMLYEKQITFFFKYKSQMFGCKEEDRIAFAKMKSLESKPLEYKKETFYGYNLKKLLENIEEKKIFSKKDFKEIKVIQIEDVIKKLKI
jgi:hypothetical protein